MAGTRDPDRASDSEAAPTRRRVAPGSGAAASGGSRPGAAAGVPRFWSLAVAAVALAVYLLQSPRVSGDKDSSEFTLVLALNGVAHPTGYPLYTLFGHEFASILHSLGATWAYAANAWSAAGGAVAIIASRRG